MSDVLKQAVDVVAGVERGEVLRHIEMLLEKYPGGPCAFVIAGELPDDQHAIALTGNATIPAMDYLFMAGRMALFMGEQTNGE